MVQAQEKTLVTFLLDRTGSMESIKDDTIGAFNAYLDTLKDTSLGGDVDAIKFTLVQFDSQSLDKVCVAIPVKQAKPLTKDTFKPRAATPLIDAAYKTIKAVESQAAAKDAKIVICIQTDGFENASTEHTWDELNALIKEKTALGWQFNFMGASIDAYQQATAMGIGACSTMSYDSSQTGTTQAAFRASAANLRSFAAGQSANTSYSTSQKSASGDVYDPVLTHKKSKPGTKIVPPVASPQVKTKAVDDFSL